MNTLQKTSLGILLALPLSGAAAQTPVPNPLIHADVPDPSIILVDDTWYMTSTTMHLAPGVPVMASKDLTRWETIGYAYGTLDGSDALNLEKGKNAYGKGSWASSLRYHEGSFYVLVPSYTTGKTHLYSTRDPARGPWQEARFPFWHDPSLLFDDDGRVWVVYGGGDIRIVELDPSLKTPKAGAQGRDLIPKAHSITGTSEGLPAEGAHIEKVGDWYYVSLICWPRGGMRTQLIYRSRSLEGPWEGRVVLKDRGIAQGGLFEGKDGSWWALLFRDSGAVGRIPWLVPVSWKDDWPVFGVDGVVPDKLTIPGASRAPEMGYGLVSSDDFAGTTPGLWWQWNHNPLDSHWSLAARPGWLRITSSRVDQGLFNVRNMLTQRSFGPKSSALIRLDAQALGEGDLAGLAALQFDYGYIGVRRRNGDLVLVAAIAPDGKPREEEICTLEEPVVQLRIDMDFSNRRDTATFFYSLDGERWLPAGSPLKMRYRLEHFMGYRFALFMQSTRQNGGYADFDWYKTGTGCFDTIPFP